MRPNAIVVCVEYDDLLAVTLPRLASQCGSVVVVTSPADERTMAVVASVPNAVLYCTDAFYRDPRRPFDKGSAMEEGFDVLGRDGWLLVVDADTLLPPNMLERLECSSGKLYGCQRRMLTDVRQLRTFDDDWTVLSHGPESDKQEVAGYFQLFNAGAPALANKKKKWYAGSADCGGCDSRFQAHWRPDDKTFLPHEVLHLGPHGTNWCGRVSARLDGRPVHDLEGKLARMRNRGHRVSMNPRLLAEHVNEHGVTITRIAHDRGPATTPAEAAVIARGGVMLSDDFGAQAAAEKKRHEAWKVPPSVPPGDSVAVGGARVMEEMQRQQASAMGAPEGLLYGQSRPVGSSEKVVYYAPGQEHEAKALLKMYSPQDRRPHVAWRNGVIQLWVTRACDKACSHCTQGSNLAGRPGMVTVDQFRAMCESVRGYWGVVGMFGGNPATHPQFEELCAVMRSVIPAEQRGLWCNNLRGKGKVARQTFNPRYSNLNVHLDQDALAEFRRDWPEAIVIGDKTDSRHAPVYVSMKDVVPDEAERWRLISTCDVNQTWSAMACVVRGEPRGFFCEIAGAMAMLHENDDSYPDLGVPLLTHGCRPWWDRPIQGDEFREQVRFYCHRCSVPLRGYGELATTGKVEQVSAEHAAYCKPKDRSVEQQVVVSLDQLRQDGVKRATDYIANAGR